jgi:hypothetical protein
MTVTKIDIEATTAEEPIMLGGSALAADDFVKVKPSSPGRKDGFVGVFRGIWIDDDGKVTGVDVWGDKRISRQRMRTFRPERIEVLSPREQKRRRKARREGADE